MVDSYITVSLGRAFPGSFINTSCEFIAHKQANEYFLIDNCNSELDVKCKVLEWLSRGAHKTCPFNNNLKNERFHNFMLNGINDFLGTDFTEKDMQIIYNYLGNAIDHERTVEFIQSGYDMAFFKQFESVVDNG